MSAENSPGLATGADEVPDFDIRSDVESTAPDANPPVAYSVPGLEKVHADELAQSKIDAEVARERGYQTIPRPTKNDQRMRQYMNRLDMPKWATDEDRYFPGLLVPMYGPRGNAVTAQFKPRVPVANSSGKKMKYASRRGRASTLDVHPRNKDRIIDPTVNLWITEGVKKADSLLSVAERCVIALAGVFNWRSTLGTLGEWEDVALKGRTVVICFDSDARTNPNVLRAMIRLGRWLKSRGVKTVGYLIVPEKVGDTPVKGVDDFFAAGGTFDTLKAAIKTQPPRIELPSDAFTDARLAEVIADDLLIDRFIWAAGPRWMQWNEKHWEMCDEKVPTEAVRDYALKQYKRAANEVKADNPDDREVKGWHSMLSVGRIRAVLNLAAGIEGVFKSVEDFDSEPDMFNAQNGVVDLATGELLPHDPALLMTKVAKGSYRQGYIHEDWESALTALPKPERDWFKLRMGQAITGHITPDGVMPVLQGGGENGKSALTTDGPVVALGGYAGVASAKLFAGGNASEHSTERADLQGQRFLMAEELTEGRSINVTALKQIQDVGTIKARFVHRDNIQFEASHSLFVTTNYVPSISETDHGTWRRLAMLRFPYTFHKPSVYRQLEQAGKLTEWDRLGDGELKPRIRGGATGQHDAIVTWAVEGAKEWYADKQAFSALPEAVESATRAWRAESDRVLGFWEDHLIADQECCILTTTMHTVFNAWLDAGGHHGWSKETFGQRFKGHSETAMHRVESKKSRKTSELSWPDSWTERQKEIPGGAAWMYVGVRFRDSNGA